MPKRSSCYCLRLTIIRKTRDIDDTTADGTRQQNFRQPMTPGWWDEADIITAKITASKAVLCGIRDRINSELYQPDFDC